MILSIGEQASIFFTTVAAGFVIGFIYDLFRVFRKILPHPGFLTQIEDAVFWVVVSLGMFYIMLNRTFGEIRAFNVLGVIIGAVLYFNTISILFMAASTVIINFSKKVVRFMFRIITAPIRFFYGILKIPAKFAAKQIKKLSISIRKLLLKLRRYAKIKVKKFLGEFNIISKKV